jgi:hypothetical protein
MSQETHESMEMLGMQADELDNLIQCLEFPLPNTTHVRQLKLALPKIRDALRKVYVVETGDNPWEQETR